MSILRVFGKILGSFLLSTSISLVLLNMMLIEITSYETLKSFTADIIQIPSNIGSNQLNQVHSSLKAECKDKDAINLKFGNQNIEIKCTQILTSKPDDLLKIAISSIVDMAYYKKYSCEFIECLKGNDFSVILSAHGNSFLRSLQLPLSALVGVGLVTILASIETWSGKIKGIGFTLLFTSAPFFITSYFADKILLQVVPDATTQLLAIANKILAPVSFYFAILLAIGLVLVIIGFVIRKYEKVKKK